jgi:hypothetical protein
MKFCINMFYQFDSHGFLVGMTGIDGLDGMDSVEVCDVYCGCGYGCWAITAFRKFAGIQAKIT